MTSFAVLSCAPNMTSTRAHCTSLDVGYEIQPPGELMPFGLLCCNVSTFTLKILAYHYNFCFGFQIIGLLRLHGPGDSNSSVDASCIMMINDWICRALILASGCLFRHIHIISPQIFSMVRFSIQGWFLKI